MPASHGLARAHGAVIDAQRDHFVIPPNTMTADQLQQLIAAGLPCEHLEVEGDGRHFDALIVCEGFEGKRPVQRHQMVYAVLGDRMREEIHALSMKTLTPAEWAARQAAKS